MSKKDTNTAVDNKDDVKEEPKFLLSTLKENSRKLFDVSGAVFDGATASLDKDGSYTIKEIKKIIDAWLLKPVKQ